MSAPTAVTKVSASTASLTDNFIAGREHDRAFSRLGFLRGANIRSEAARAFERLGVRYGALRDPAGNLSGGNQQRLAIARELSRAPKLLVVGATDAWRRHRGLCVYP